MKPENYGNSLFKENKEFLIFIFTNLSQVAYSGIFSALIINLVILDRTGIQASYASYYSVIGSTIAGIIGGTLFLKFRKDIIGIVCPIISFLLTIPLIFIQNNNIWLIILSISFISCINSLELPNSNSTLPLFVNEKNISQAFSISQTLFQTLRLIVPISVNILLNFFNFNIVIIFFSIFYLLSTIPWIILRNIIKNKSLSDVNTDFKKKSFMSGYKEVFNNRNLLNLNIFRVSNNLIYSICGTALPMLIGLLAVTEKDIKNLTTISDFILGVSFILAGLFLSNKFIMQPKNIKKMAFLTPIIAFIGFLLFLILKNAIGFYLFSAFIGLGLYSGRISVITIGQKITPNELLSVSILAGDTMTKIATVIFNFLFLKIVNSTQFGIGTVLFMFLFIGIFGVIWVIDPSNEFIKKQSLGVDK